VIGEQTALLVKDRFTLLELDLVRVKGKSQPERIFTILGPAELGAQPVYQEVRQATHELLQRYRRREWQAAKDTLGRFAQSYAALDLGGLHALYARRVEEFTLLPPPEDWDGAFDAQSK
jgi:adenylate cyclase